MKPSTREWLKAADDDLETIKSLLKNIGLTNIVAFHAQQVIEKSFKAVVEEFGIEFIKTHNLETLFLRIKPFLDLSVNEMIIAELDRLYIDSRYPGDIGLMPLGKPTLDEAALYFSEAEMIRFKIEQLLNR